jgi:hypothetical protein
MAALPLWRSAGCKCTRPGSTDQRRKGRGIFIGSFGYRLSIIIDQLIFCSMREATTYFEGHPEPDGGDPQILAHQPFVRWRVWIHAIYVFCIFKEQTQVLMPHSGQHKANDHSD